MLKKKYPTSIEETIRGYHIFTAGYLGFAAYTIITGHSAVAVLMILAFCSVIELLCMRYKRRVIKKGFVYWKFKVLSDSFFIYKRKKYNCILAAPLTAPQADKKFEIILKRKDKIPKLGSIIEVCGPGDMGVLNAQNRYIISGYYELNVEGEQLSVGMKARRDRAGDDL